MRNRIRNLSVRKSIILYLTVSLVLCFLLSAIVTLTASDIQEQIWAKYTESDSRGGDYWLGVVRPPASEMSWADHRISEICDFMQTYSVLIISVAGSCVAVLLFYRNKLKEPIEELELASRRIAENDLDFRIMYENKDEMGRLCHEFDHMRGQLAENNRKTWRMIEDERALRAAVAHDIRSPLSVLKGYQEMLCDYLPDGTISPEQTREMLKESMKQICRMDDFISAMQKMNSLEHRELHADKITGKQLEKDIRAEIEILGAGKTVTLEVTSTDQAGRSGESTGGTGRSVPVFTGDREVILEVMENLLSNALRYAREQIRIRVVFSEEELSVSVSDDGSGFAEKEGDVTRAFHQKNMKDSLNHTGLGMYISRLYCEKHGGQLLLENEEEGGALVTAVFRRIA